MNKITILKLTILENILTLAIAASVICLAPGGWKWSSLLFFLNLNTMSVILSKDDSDLTKKD